MSCGRPIDEYHQVISGALSPSQLHPLKQFTANPECLKEGVYEMWLLSSAVFETPEKIGVVRSIPSVRDRPGH
jgi:hypothetical protein